jgi:steroid delta-isomerase-like uncharacterized protein
MINLTPICNKPGNLNKLKIPLTRILTIVLFISISIYSQEQQSRTILTPDSFVRGWLDAWNSHNVDRILSYYTEDAFYEDVPSVENGWDVPLHGHQMIRKAVVSTFEEMPDLKFEFGSVSFNAGNYMVIEWTMTGSRYLELTGRFSTRAVSVIKFKGNKIAWERDYYDVYQILNRLGMVSVPKTEKKKIGKEAQNKQRLEQNKEVIQRNTAEVWSRGNLNILEELYTPDFICHFIVGPEWRGYKGIRKAVSGHRTSFPDWIEQIVDIVAEGDRVAIRFRSRGTQKGEFNGIPPTGRKVDIFEVAIFRLENGRIAEQWGFPDIMGLRQQLTENLIPEK